MIAVPRLSRRGALTRCGSRSSLLTSFAPAHVEMIGLIGMGNNPMVGATVAVAVAVAQAMNE